ncbi:MAG TPA: efflux RND transporter permease subunit, partial [Planctomycetes bacterium]|nr:efflux RND transporter permease subunit [Planctomycetota bacterium]
MTASTPRRLFDRPVMVLMLLLTVVVIGGISLVSTPLQLFPPGFVDRTVSVYIAVRESTALEVSERIAEPAEELLRTIPGLSRIRSFSSPDGCSISVTISGDAPADEVYADIADRMERLRPTLPEGSERYRIFRFDLETDIPVVSLGVTSSSDDNIEALLENVVRQRLEAVKGVARVEIRGLTGKAVSIELDPDQVWAHRIDLRNLISRLQGESVEGSAGTVVDSGRRFVLRLGSRFDDLDSLRQFPVTDSLRLGDIAEIKIKYGLRDFIVRLNGRLCNIIDISKESDANTVDVCRTLDEVLAGEIGGDPRLAGIEFTEFFDQGKVIASSLGSLRDSCAYGGLLAVLVLWLFLRRMSSTLIVAGAIPLSLLIAVVVIWAKGGTFNLLSMTGLTIGIGMLIDNAIVVSESVFRCSDTLEDPGDAVAAGVGEVALAVTLATLTTVAVFVPLVFLAGDSNTRMMLGEFGLPVCYSIIASLLVALLFIPVGLRFSGAVRHDNSRKEWALTERYSRLLSRVLDHRLACFWLLLLVLGTSSFPVRWLSVRSAASGPSHRVAIYVEFPDSRSLSDSDQTMERIRQSYASLAEEWKVADVAAWFRRGGGTLAFFFSPGTQVDTSGFIALLRRNNPNLPGVDIQFSGGEGEREADRLRVVVKGPEAKEVAAISDQLEDVLAEMAGIAEVSGARDSSRTASEVTVDVDREKAKRFGISPTGVSSIVGWMLRGAPLPQAQIAGEDLSVWISYSEDESPTLGELAGIPMSDGRGGSLPLGAIATFSMSRTP